MNTINKNFLVVSDYNWLPANLDESWVLKATNKYLIYDKASRLGKSKKVIHQRNVGQNIYDLFDFIVNSYGALPDVTVFCRAAVFLPKGQAKPLSSGNCSESVFFELANRENFTEIHDYGADIHDGISSKIGPNGEFLELNNSWYLKIHRGRYYKSLNDFFADIYIEKFQPEYIRFSPGASYVIPREMILNKPKFFYECIRELVGWGVVVGEAHMLERAIYTLFNSEKRIKDCYLKRHPFNAVKLIFRRIRTKCWYVAYDIFIIARRYIKVDNEK